MNPRQPAPAPNVRRRGGRVRLSSLALGALCAAAGAVALAAARNAHPALLQGSSDPDAIQQARALVRELIGARPAENIVQTGWLRIWEGRRLRAVVPVRCSVIVETSHWLSIYEALSTNLPPRAGTAPPAPASGSTPPPADASVVERLIVRHQADAPNTYQLERRNRDTIKRQTLGPDALMKPFADSDFWIADLGLEFLHWPEQKVLRHELKRSRACVVLESRCADPAAEGYVRVLSWIDRETGGIVQAEGFDARDRKLKEFAPRSFKKANGQWLLQEMEIRNLQTGSRTRLAFALPQDTAP